jgi:HEAT repeat protein
LEKRISFNSKVWIMWTKFAVFIMLTAAFAMPAFAVDVDRWVQEIKDQSLSLQDTGEAKSLMQTLMDRQVRGQAVKKLGAFNDTASVEPLIRVLKDEERIVRASAAMALGYLGDARAVEPLIQVLDNDEDRLVRTSAAEALGRLNDCRAIE